MDEWRVRGQKQEGWKERERGEEEGGSGWLMPRCLMGWFSLFSALPVDMSCFIFPLVFFPLLSFLVRLP